MNEVIFDIEGDSLEPTKIHVVSFSINNEKVQSVYEYNEIKSFFQEQIAAGSYLIGHNIILWDTRHLSRLLGISFQKAKLIDTLGLAWYLEPSRREKTKLGYGLEDYGLQYGLPKIEIEDWVNLSQEEYTLRCERDVQITQRLWDQQKSHLIQLYEKSDSAKRIIHYLTDKLKQAALALDYGWKLDVEKTRKNLETLQKLKSDKEDTLRKILPSVPKTVLRTKPKVKFRKDGSISSRYSEWVSRLQNLGLAEDTTESFEDVVGYEEPNPGSHQQVKDWLFSIGWKPCTYKTNPKGKEVPQVTKLDSEELTNSVKLLQEKYPEIEALEGLFCLKHRIGLLEGFLNNVDDKGYLRAEIAGLTNTLRFKHSIIVNLPIIGRPYGEYIRSCLIAPYGFVLCGSDMVGLEDRTKQHYIYEFDPKYVEEMNIDGWDSHLDLGVKSGLITKEEEKFYKWYQRQNN